MRATAPVLPTGRFGRATASQVIDQVESRMEASREKAWAVTIGNREIGTGTASALGVELAGMLASNETGDRQRSGYPGAQGAGPLDGSELLQTALGGGMSTRLFGADYARGDWIIGLGVGDSRGDGEYQGQGSGRVDAPMLGFYPWIGWKANARTSVWAVGGRGTGRLQLTPGQGGSIATVMSMTMMAAGTRTEIVGNGAGGFGLAVKSDGLWVRTATAGRTGDAGRLAAAAARVTRFRAASKGSRTVVRGTTTLTPTVELGLRHDGGDAEVGGGADVATGLRLTESRNGLSIDVQVRMLLMHQVDGFSERGVAVAIGYDPTPASPTGYRRPRPCRA